MIVLCSNNIALQRDENNSKEQIFLTFIFIGSNKRSNNFAKLKGDVCTIITFTRCQFKNLYNNERI